MMAILVTGCAGFIGFHTALELIKQNYNVIGIDNINDYYDPNLKLDRLSILRNFDKFSFYKVDISNYKDLEDIFNNNQIEVVIHLAAQAGVRYSLINPHAYISSNIVGFENILECCKKIQIKHLIFASSSSVYGANTKVPFSVKHNVDHPVSLYAATKKANELMAHTYAYLFQLPVTGLRFFTVYGPWGRPDMALFIFTKSIIENKPINVYNYGNMWRDFTYITDIVEAIIRLINKIPQPNKNWNSDNPDPSSSVAPYKIYNIGNNQPIKLLDFIEIIERKLNKKAMKNFLPMQPGDVLYTYADIDELQKDINFKPSTNIEIGIENFINWYKEYYKIS